MSDEEIKTQYSLAIKQIKWLERKIAELKQIVEVRERRKQWLSKIR